MTDFRSKLYKPGLIALAVVLLVSAFFSQRGLNHKREALGLTRIPPLENAPPVLAFTTVALGGFRGLIANALWIRLNDLQEQDKYFEMVQLADWISKLQPHFSTVWIHLAWNMSYNISIKFSNPEDRWPWVRRGIELLRDEGLRYNPNDPIIYRELAWHFQHKIGHNLDDAHNYYKYILAEEMMQAIGRRGQPDFEALIKPQTEEAKARAELLTEKFKMNPAWMREVDQTYGPLEWRLPETHAIYWAYVGLNKTDKNRLKKEDLLNLRRVIFQSMQLAFTRGRMIYPSRDGTEFILAPNLDIVPQASEAYEQMMEQEPDKRDHLATGHKNFLRRAVYFLYVYNRTSEAQKWFNTLRQKYPSGVPEGMDLDEFALAKVSEDIGETSHDNIKAILEGLLTQSFINLAIDEDALAVNYERFARKIHARFMESIGEISRDRVGLPQLSHLKKEVLNRLLDPEDGLDPETAAQLRTKLGLPADAVTVTGNVPSPTTGSSTNLIGIASGKSTNTVKSATSK